MKTLEKGQDKIKKICDALRHETLEPAQKEAQGIVDEANEKAEEIIANAKKEAEKVLKLAHEQVEQEKNVFHSSMSQAAKQTLETLKQSIEHKLFHSELQRILEQQTADPKLVANLIGSIVKAIDKEGISANLSAIIPKSVSAAEVNALLGENIIKKLKENSVVLGGIPGGAQVKLHDKNMTVDISDAALMELLTSYIRKDLRKLIFES